MRPPCSIVRAPPCHRCCCGCRSCLVAGCAFLVHRITAFQLIKRFTSGRTKAKVNPPAAVPNITGTDTESQLSVALSASFHSCSRMHFLTVVERSGDMVRNAGLNLRKGRVGRSDGHRRYQLTRLSDTISHGGTKKPPRNRNRGSSLAGRPRDTMLIGQTYAKDAGRSCSDLPNYCDYAPRFRAEERGLLRGRKPKLLRSRFIQRPLNQICCSAAAKLLGRG